MAVTEFDPGTDTPTSEQQAAEQAALEQGEKILQAEAADKEGLYDQANKENEDVSLIGGKFKSQEDLLKAYNELQSKLGKGETEETEEQEAPTEEAVEEEVVEEASETIKLMTDLGAQFDKGEELSPESIDKLAAMDSKDLIKSYLEYNKTASAASQQAQIQASEIQAIQQSVGGAEAYNEMISWASSNLGEQEIADFNTVTNSGNPVAIKFAVESLSTRYKSSEGFEAPLVTGKKASSSVKAYRSQAELARDIANPLYHSDPAFRMDVEEKLSRSTNLL